MKRIAVIALTVSAALSMIHPAAAREPVRPAWTPYGSAVCPSNYQYYEGWCHWVPRGRDGYADRYGYRREYREYSEPREGYGGHIAPVHWN